MGESLPNLRSVVGLRGRSATLGLRQGPNCVGQQCGILDNGRKLDPVISRLGEKAQEAVNQCCMEENYDGTLHL